MKGCNKIYLKTWKIICLKNDQLRGYLYLKHFQSNDTLKNRSALRTYVGFRNTCGVLIRNGVFLSGENADFICGWLAWSFD